MTTKFIDKAETLARVMDDLAIDGKIEPAAIPSFIKTVRSEIVVDPGTNSLLLHGKPLRQAVEDVLSKDKFWAPRGGEEHREEVESELLIDAQKKKALTGNVTEHGRLRNLMGSDEEYHAWCAETGAKPGVAINAVEVNGKTQHQIKKPAPTNPWSAAGWNFTAQGRLVRAIGEEKATEIAAAAGCKLGSTKPNPAFN